MFLGHKTHYMRTYRLGAMRRGRVDDGAGRAAAAPDAAQPVGAGPGPRRPLALTRRGRGRRGWKRPGSGTMFAAA